MVVYLDVLWATQSLFDGVLLFMTARLLRRPTKWWRLLLAGGIGGGGGTGLLILSPPRAGGAALAIALSLIMATVAFGRQRRLRKTLLVQACFYSVAFSLSGILLGLSRLIAPPCGVALASLYYPRLSTLTLILFLLCALIALQLIEQFLRQRKRQNDLVSLRFCLHGHRIALSALTDTGCSLCDPLYRLPVVVVELSAIKFALSSEEYAFLSGEGDSPPSENPFHPLCYHSLGQENGRLWALSPLEITLCASAKEAQKKRACLALYPRSVSTNDTYQALIPPQLIS